MCSCTAFARCRSEPGSFNHWLVASIDGNFAAASFGSPILAERGGTNASTAKYLKSNPKFFERRDVAVGVANTLELASRRLESKFGDGPVDSESMVDTPEATILSSSTKSG